LSLPARVRIQGEVDMIQQAKPAELVENDPGRVKTQKFEARRE